jgi:ribosomal protein L6P/L9E
MSDNEARVAKVGGEVLAVCSEVRDVAYWQASRSVPSGSKSSFRSDPECQGSLGTLRLVLTNEVTASIADGAVTIAPKNETKQSRAMWGTTRALVNNMVTGVSKVLGHP